MRQPKKLTSKDLFNNAQTSYVQGVDKVSNQTGVPSTSVELFDNASKAPLTDYQGEYSPAPVMGGGESTRVDFGTTAFNSRLGAGMRAELNPQDAYYENQGGIETAAKFVGGVASGAVIKALEGIAVLGSALGEGTLKGADYLTGGMLEKLGYDGEFNFDDVTENPLVKTLFDSEQWMKDNLFKVYQPTNWNDQSFFEQVRDGAWWGNEGADGIAFALSNFIPAGLLGKAGLGAKAMSGLADLADMNAFTRFMTAGKAGLLKSGSVANIADRAVATAFMTSTESLFEAKDTGDTFTNQYLQRYNQSNPQNTVESIDQLDEIDPVAAADLRAKKGDAMKHTFFANMAALSASNWIEAGLLNKMMGKSSRSLLAEELQASGKIADPLIRLQRKGLDKFFNNTRLGYTGKTIVQQMAVEGLYEENIQHAIQNVSQNMALNGKIDTMAFMEDVGKEMFTNLGDKEAWKSIGAGMVIGGLFGGVAAAGIPGVSKGAYGNKEAAIQEGLSKLNGLSNNLRSVGQIYQKDTEGNILYDAEGNPQVDSQKLQNFVTNLVQAKNTQTIHDYYKSKGENELAEIVKNEHIANYVKGFMESGLEDELKTKIKDLNGYTEEDLVQFGFDPVELNERGEKVSIGQRFQALQDKVNDYANQYKVISKLIPSNERARQGEALSWYARYKHLQGLQSRLEQRRNLLAVSTPEDNQTIKTINALAAKHAALTAELPNQEKYSLPKRIESTKRELLLIEKEIGELKSNSREVLTNAGVVITPGVEKIGISESPEQKEADNIDITLTQVNNSINDAKDKYDGLTSREGGTEFYNSLGNRVDELISNQENEDNIVEGDYVSVDNGTTTREGFVSINEAGDRVVNGQIINDAFLENNKVTKFTEEEVQALKDTNVENFRKKQIADRINNLSSIIAGFNERIKNGEEHILNQIIEKEDIILNQSNGTIRLTQKQLAKQLKQIERSIADSEDLLAKLEEAKERATNDLTELKYLYDTPETIEEVQDLIDRTEDEIREVESNIARTQPIVDRLKSLYFSMLNTWRTLFPTAEYKSLEDRAAEIEDAISRGVDPATFETEGIGIANKLSDYTDYKQDLQFTGAEMRQAVRDLDELKATRDLLYNQLDQYQQRLAQYQLEANKLNYTKTLRPETGQKETKGNPPTKSKTETKNPFNDKKNRDVSNSLFSTAGSHIKGEALTTDETQLRWYKFAESYNPTTKTARLRTVTISDPEYGIGAPNDVYANDSDEFKIDSHFKVVVVNKDGNPITRNGELVFTSLPTPKEDFSKFSNRNNWDEEKIKQYNEDYTALLNKAKVEPQFLDITNRSNGIARKGEPISINKAFGTEDIDLRLITDGSTVINEKEYPLYKGLVYAVYDGRPVGLLVRKLNETEKDAAIARLKEYAEVRGNKEGNGKSILSQLTSTFFLGQRNDNPQQSIYFLKGEDKLVFGDNIITHEELLSGRYDVQLDQFLSDINHHVDNSQLGKKEEYRDITGKKWNNYSEYLVKEREESPLMSDLVPKSQDINNPQFVNTYLEFSNGKVKSKAPASTGKGKKKNFSSGLDFTDISSFNEVALESGLNAEPVIDERIPDSSNVEIPDGLNVRSFESFLEEETIEKEEKAGTEEEQTFNVGGKNVSADALAEAKALREELMAEMMNEAAEESKETKSNDIIGSDDLFDDLFLGSERLNKPIELVYDSRNLVIRPSDITLSTDYIDLSPEQGISSFGIMAKGERIGYFEIFNDNGTFQILGSEIYKEDYNNYHSEASWTRNSKKGIGTIAYEKLGDMLYKEYGITINSGNLREPQANALWERLIRRGRAFKNGDIYTFIPNSTSNVANSYSPINFEKEQKWFRENISSTIPFEKVQGLIEDHAFGVFTANGEILISDAATSGTGYHEAFHVVSNLYLTSEEQTKLHKEWIGKNTNRLEDLRKEPIYVGKSDTLIAEEELAEEFREYILTNTSEYSSWFSKLVSFIKGLLSLNTNQRDELFKRISLGAFKNNEALTRPTINLYSSVKALGASAKKELMDGMTVTLFANLFKNGFDISDIRGFNKGELGAARYERFQNIFNDSFDRTIGDIQIHGPAQINSKMNKGQFIQLLTSPKMKEAIIKEHIKHLYQFNVKFNLEEDTNLDTLPEGDKGRDTLGIIDSIEFSTKNSMPPAIKILIASLPQVEIQNGKKGLKRSPLGLLMPTDYRRNVSILHNTLAGISNFEEQLDAIKGLEPKIPELGILVKKLETKDATTEEGFYLQSQFRQQFDKNRYTFFMQLYDGTNSYLVDANSSRMIDLIKAKWQGALRTNLKSLKIVDGQQVLNEDYFKQYDKLGPDVRGSILSFYKDLGITFSNPENVDIDNLADTMKALMSTIKEGEVQADIFEQEGIKGYMNRVIEQEVKTSMDYSDNQHINPEGKTVYNISLNDYLSLSTTEMNKGIPSHLEWNEETQTGNPLTRNSTWINKLRQGKKINTIILEGARVEEVGENGKSTANLTRGEAAVQQITSIMKGVFPFLRAGDKSLEKGFTFNEGIGDLRIQEANQIFRGYLADELLSAYMLNVEGIGSDVKTYNTLGKKLRIFEGILGTKDQKDADKLMNSKLDRKKTIAAIDAFVERPSVIKAIEGYMESKVADNLQELQDNRIVRKDDKEWVNLGLPNELVEKYVGDETTLTNAQMENLVSQFTYQSLISNIEQTKMFTGDIAFFKDFFKRTSGLVGTGKTAWVGRYVDKLLNTLFTRPDKKSDSQVKSWVFSDVVASSETFNDFVDAYVANGFTKTEATSLLSNYLNNEEADAQGYVTLPEYREFNLRMGDWNNDREEVYNKAMGNEKLTKEDVMMLNPEKPQMYAPQQYDELYVPVFYKFSIMPLIPSVIKGRTLEVLNQRMMDNGIGMSVFESGNKVGARNVKSFYKEDGTFNDTDVTPSHVFNYKYMKKQLDINPETKDKVIFGTQFRKLILSGLSNTNLTIKGKLVNGTDIIKEYNSLINKQVKIETEKLIKKLGITQDGKEFKISNVEVLREMLKDEGLKRTAPDNMIESIEKIFTQGAVKPVELSVNRNKIEQILMSLVNNNIIKQKVFGGSLVQAASTGFETKPRKYSSITKEKWASNLDTLQFYKPTEGDTLAMEVYLPYKFKELMNVEDIGTIDNRLKQLIAFRIPTQGLNSIEAITVKGFLPREAGDIIVVPTEGVTKSGWDFDVDKLNVFFPNYTFNKFTRKPEYVEYTEDSNNAAAVQNRIIELSRQITLAKENFVPLTTPNTTQDLLDMEKEIASLNPSLARNDNQRSKFVDWAYNLNIRQTYLLGKAGVGQAALQNVNHVMAQIAKLGMKKDGEIFLKHHTDAENNIDLSRDKDVDNNRAGIQEIISQTLNGFVDIARDPFLKTLNITPETSNLFFFLTRIGTPLRQTTLFLNQPIIRDYLQELESNNALYLDQSETLSKKDLLEQVYAKWSGTGKIIESDEEMRQALSEENLAKYIKDGGENNVIQQAILGEYLSYKTQAEKLVSLIQAVNFDTTSSSSIEGARTKIEDYFELKNEETFINLPAMLKETFLGSFARATENSINLYKDLFITESNEQIRLKLDQIKKDFKPIRGLDIDKAMNLAKNEMISHLLQNSKLSGKTVGSFIKSMFVDKETSIARVVAQLKNTSLANNYLIRELTPILSRTSRTQAVDSTDVDNIKMFTKRLVVEEQNLITDAWRELFEHEGSTVKETEIVQSFANRLMIASLLQSGLNNSPLSFTQFIPNEYYFKLSSKLIDNALDGNVNLEEFRDKFYKNNYKSNDIVPRVKYFNKRGNNEIADASARPYVKTWDKKRKNWKLYRNTYELEGKKYIFEEVNKLGDGFNFKEYASSISVLSSNEISHVEEFKIPKGKTTKNKMISQIQESDFNDKTKAEYIKRINEAKDIQEVADIWKELCK